MPTEGEAETSLCIWASFEAADCVSYKGKGKKDGKAEGEQQESLLLYHLEGKDVYFSCISGYCGHCLHLSLLVCTLAAHR